MGIKWGLNSDHGDQSHIIEKVKRMLEEGWRVRIKPQYGRPYVTARKMDNGRRVERGLGYASSEEVEEIKKMNTLYTTTRSRRRKRKIKESREFGKGGRGFLSGLEFLERFRVHRLGLRFDVPGKRVNVAALYGLGEVSYEPRNGQHVVRVGVGVRRVVTIQVNRDGSAQIYLECSDNPMNFFEFLGFCYFWLLETFSRLTGAIVNLEDFRVFVAPEFNIDLPGVVIAEETRSLTLKDLYEGLVVRIYRVGKDEKMSMPDGGTRVEVMAKNFQGEKLKNAVDDVISLALLPEVLKKLEEIKSRLLSIEKEVQALRNEGITNLSVEKEVKGITFMDIPEDLQWALRELEQLGYVRVKEDRVEYGDRVWAAIRRYHGNIDGWIEWEAQGLVGKMRGIFKNVIGAIRYYDNKYEGKPGVPYDKFLEAFELSHRKKEQVDRYNAIP